MKATARIGISLALISLIIGAFYFIQFSLSAPSQTSTYWRDNFTDQSGIAALSGLNFSTGNLSLNNSPWFYPNHDYRKQIAINGSTSLLNDYQIPINLTTALYNNTGLVGSWHFTNNDTSDSSGYGNNGVQNGGVNCSVVGKFGTGCSFNGVNGYVDAGNGASIGLTDNYTLEAWIKIAGSPSDGRGTIVSKSMSYYLQYIPSGSGWNISWYHYGRTPAAYQNSNSLLQSGNWYHVVLVSSSAQDILYINGAMDATAGVSGSITATSYDLAIGGETYTSPYRYFNGTIDEVRVYNRSLSAAEIAEQYRAGKARLDYQDLRFTWLNTSSNSEQNISYWLESDNQAWVKVPNVTASGVANTTLYMYYGNPSAASASNGTNMFSFFDDFSGDLSKWSITGNPVIENGRLKLVGTSVSHETDKVLSTVTVARPAILEWKMQQSTTGQEEFVGYGDVAYETSYFNLNPTWNTRAMYLGSILGSRGDPPQTTNIEAYKIVILPTSGYTMYLVGSQLGTTASGTETNKKIRYSSYSGTYYIDDVRVRKYASPEP
ncbi:MAG: DUF2341 domain-containing protein, partial [Candidatus Aenigmatarchaeota archaeon]